ncbi:hypothetical protein D3C87_1892950 [compost metagenome]
MNSDESTILEEGLLQAFEFGFIGPNEIAVHQPDFSPGQVHEVNVAELRVLDGEHAVTDFSGAQRWVCQITVALAKALDVWVFHRTKPR